MSGTIPSMEMSNHQELKDNTIIIGEISPRFEAHN